MGKKPLTAAYVIFYILFWPDTWRILVGISAALLLAPRIVTLDMGTAGRVLIYVMLASIGYAFSAGLARRISATIRKLILKDRRA